MSRKLRVTYRKSAIGYSERQKQTVRSLGLRRLRQTVILPDNPAVRGMVRQVQHLVAVQPSDGSGDDHGTEEAS